MTRPARASDAPDQLLTLLRQLFDVAGSLTAAIAEVLAESDLSGSTSGLLWMLDPARPPLRMREIARSLGCDPSNVTLLGDKLQAAELVIRRPHPDDRRSRVLTLTDTGIALRARLLIRLVAATPLPTLTPREQHQLELLLGKLTNTP